MVTKTRPKLMMSGKMYRFRPHPEALDPSFLSVFLRKHDTQQRIDEMKTGINDSGLNLTHDRFAQLPVVVPPLNEQRRIVERIEALFAEINEGVRSLEAARRALGLYRRSLLKAAFEGRLTAAWRAANPDLLDTPDALLARIRKEREARHAAALAEWEEAVAVWEKNGLEGKKPRKPKKPKNINSIVQMDGLPEAWLVTTVEAAGRVETGTTPTKKNADLYGGCIPFFKPTDLDVGQDVREATEYLTDAGGKVSRLFRVGSVLVTCIGATIGKTGHASIVGACNQQINFIEPDESVCGRFAYFQAIAPSFQRQIIENASATTLPILNKSRFSALDFVICSSAEQAEIVRTLDARLGAADMLAAEIEAGLKRAEALRQSVLTEAFAGRLVSQDPGDEPATVLLKHIRTVSRLSPEQQARREYLRSSIRERMRLTMRPEVDPA